MRGKTYISTIYFIMAKIKNWTVISQRVKERQDGLVTYSKYLLDEKHKNHSKNETRIVSLHGKISEFVKNAICETLDFDMSNKKGGRKVESYAQSFVLGLPDTVRKPTDEQWKKISADMIRAAHKHLKPDEPVNDFGRKCFSNLHDQDKPHMNLLIPRIYKGERLDKLDKKGMILALKQEFNASVMKHCNINYDNYKPVNTSRGKRLENWKLEQQKLREEQEKSIKLKTEAAGAAQDAASQILLAQQTRISAQEATAIARMAKADADRSISLLNEMKGLFTQFKTSLTEWIKSIKTDDPIMEELNKVEVVERAENIQKHPTYDDEIEMVMFSSIEQAEIEAEPYTAEKQPISSKVRRKRKYTL
ncbi:hypothetical protein [Pseudomonas cichorii]|uniref:hypothetical protein n=1 Tax=Pseudomonas cichorii TaxID=36746 RepID=UPI000F001B66|nr:hypothetical protein [Pseudomonas cichorii]